MQPFVITKVGALKLIINQSIYSAALTVLKGSLTALFVWHIEYHTRILMRNDQINYFSGKWYIFNFDALARVLLHYGYKLKRRKSYVNLTRCLRVLWAAVNDRVGKLIFANTF